jgi:uncharacterized protein (TIGR02145 family)
MKKIFYLLFCWRFKRHFVALCATQLLTLDFFLQAQAPQGIPYQAIARNASGVAIANTAVKVRFSIRDSIATGAIKYQETHNPTTSALGLFSVNVGMGTVVSGSFSGINWGKNAKFLQVELNTTGGTSYTDLGTTQMMSVPFSLYSGSTKFKVSSSGDTLILGESQVVIIPGISTSNNQNIGSKVLDVDGNAYGTIKIGDQIWIKENLRVTKFQNGDPIQFVAYDPNSSNFFFTNSPAYTSFFTNQDILKVYGLNYNGLCISDQRGLCPIGYRVPNNSDWIRLVANLRNIGFGIAGSNNQGVGKSITVGNWNYSEVFASPDRKSTRLNSSH